MGTKENCQSLRLTTVTTYMLSGETIHLFAPCSKPAGGLKDNERGLVHIYTYRLESAVGLPIAFLGACGPHAELLRVNQKLES